MSRRVIEIVCLVGLGAAVFFGVRHVRARTTQPPGKTKIVVATSRMPLTVKAESPAPGRIKVTAEVTNLAHPMRDVKVWFRVEVRDAAQEGRVVWEHHYDAAHHVKAPRGEKRTVKLSEILPQAFPPGTYEIYVDQRIDRPTLDIDGNVTSPTTRLNGIATKPIEVK